MNALLLAAGRGNRLRPITDHTPKCLVPINGRPLMDFWLSSLVASEKVFRIFVNLHYLSDLVERYVEGSPYAGHVEFIRESCLLGTGGTLVNFLKSTQRDDQDLLVAHADNLSLFDIKDFIEHHLRRPSNCLITAMTFETDTPQSCGIFELNPTGVVTNFFEKVPHPPGNLANAAVFLLSPEAQSRIISYAGDERWRQTPELDFSRQFLPLFVGSIFAYSNEVYHRDIGTMDSLRKACYELPSVIAAHPQFG